MENQHFPFLFGPAARVCLLIVILTSFKTMLCLHSWLTPWWVSPRPETAWHHQSSLLTHVLITRTPQRLLPVPIPLSQDLSRLHLAEQLSLGLLSLFSPQPWPFLAAPPTHRRGSGPQEHGDKSFSFLVQNNLHPHQIQKDMLSLFSPGIAVQMQIIRQNCSFRRKTTIQIYTEKWLKVMPIWIISSNRRHVPLWKRGVWNALGQAVVPLTVWEHSSFIHGHSHSVNKHVLSPAVCEALGWVLKTQQ